MDRSQSLLLVSFVLSFPVVPSTPVAAAVAGSQTYDQLSASLIPPPVESNAFILDTIDEDPPLQASASLTNRHWTRSPKLKSKLNFLRRFRNLIRRKRRRKHRYEDDHQAEWQGSKGLWSHESSDSDSFGPWHTESWSSYDYEHERPDPEYPEFKYKHKPDEKPNKQKDNMSSTHQPEHKQKIQGSGHRLQHGKNFHMAEMAVAVTEAYDEKPYGAMAMMGHSQNEREREPPREASAPGEKFLAASVLAVIVSGIGILFFTIVAYVGLIVQKKVPRAEAETEAEGEEEKELNLERLKKGLYSIHFHFHDKAEAKEKKTKRKKGKEKEKEKEKETEEEEKEARKEKAADILEFIREIIAVDAYSHHLAAGSIGLTNLGISELTGGGGGGTEG